MEARKAKAIAAVASASETQICQDRRNVRETDSAGAGTTASFAEHSPVLSSLGREGFMTGPRVAGHRAAVVEYLCAVVTVAIARYKH
jgi:hypothetical protein